MDFLISCMRLFFAVQSDTLSECSETFRVAGWSNELEQPNRELRGQNTAWVESSAWEGRKPTGRRQPLPLPVFIRGWNRWKWLPPQLLRRRCREQHHLVRIHPPPGFHLVSPAQGKAFVSVRSHSCSAWSHILSYQDHKSCRSSTILGRENSCCSRFKPWAAFRWWGRTCPRPREAASRPWTRPPSSSTPSWDGWPTPLGGDECPAPSWCTSTRTRSSETSSTTPFEVVRSCVRCMLHAVCWSFVSGFSETSEACCELSSAMEDGRGILCRRGGRACGDRDAHVFFDGLHPTDAVNMRIAVKAYGSNLKAEAYPMNVGHLARLSI